MLGCGKSKCLFKNHSYDAFVITYIEEHKADSETNRVKSKVVYAKNLCIAEIEYYDQNNALLMKRELVDILDSNEVLKKAS